MTTKKLLLVGAGYVGGSVLSRLLQDPVLRNEYIITVTARSDDQLAQLKQLGVNTVKASLDDLDIIEAAVADTDILINTASSDHIESVEASLKGIQKRVDAGKSTVYIHTSGTGVIGDDVAGLKESDVIFTDTNPDQIEALDDGRIHRRIDKRIAHQAAQWSKSGASTEIRIILPPLIYGRGTGPFNKISIQIPTLIKVSLAEGYAGMHGEGKSMWSHVHVQDLAEGYVTLLRGLQKDGSPKLKSIYDIYVFCESGEHHWREVSERIGKELHNQKAISSPEPKSLTKEAIEKHMLVYPKSMWSGSLDCQPVGSNSRSRAVKLREMGWKPKRQETLEDFLNTISDDVKDVLGQKK